MISVKQVIKYANANAIEVTWADANGVNVRCQSYSDRQMAELRADLGAAAQTYAALIAEVEANQKPLPPPPPAVYVCSPWQIRKALNAAGLRAAVENAVAASTDQALKDGWEFATEIRSTDALVMQLGAALGKSKADIDNLIAQASSL